MKRSPGTRLLYAVLRRKQHEHRLGNEASSVSTCPSGTRQLPPSRFWAKGSGA